MRLVHFSILLLALGCVAGELVQQFGAGNNFMPPPMLDIALGECDKDPLEQTLPCVLPANANIQLSDLGAGAVTDAQVTIDVHPVPRLEFDDTHQTYFRAVRNLRLRVGQSIIQKARRTLFLTLLISQWDVDQVAGKAFLEPAIGHDE